VDIEVGPQEDFLADTATHYAEGATRCVHQLEGDAETKGARHIAQGAGGRTLGCAAGTTGTQDKAVVPGSSSVSML